MYTVEVCLPYLCNCFVLWCLSTLSLTPMHLHTGLPAHCTRPWTPVSGGYNARTGMVRNACSWRKEYTRVQAHWYVVYVHSWLNKLALRSVLKNDSGVRCIPLKEEKSLGHLIQPLLDLLLTIAWPHYHKLRELMAGSVSVSVWNPSLFTIGIDWCTPYLPPPSPQAKKRCSWIMVCHHIVHT